MGSGGFAGYGIHVNYRSGLNVAETDWTRAKLDRSAQIGTALCKPRSDHRRRGTTSWRVGCGLRAKGMSGRRHWSLPLYPTECHGRSPTSDEVTGNVVGRWMHTLMGLLVLCMIGKDVTGLPFPYVMRGFA